MTKQNFLKRFTPIYGAQIAQVLSELIDLADANSLSIFEELDQWEWFFIPKDWKSLLSWFGTRRQFEDYWDSEGLPTEVLVDIISRNHGKVYGDLLFIKKE